MKREEFDFLKKNGYCLEPKILQMEVTNKCPLNCPQCYKERHKRDIALNIASEIIREAKKSGIKVIMLNGGETILHKNFFEIVKQIEDLGMQAVCFCSGIGITQNIVEELKKLKIKLYISLNGSNEQINEKSREGFCYAMKAIQLFEKNNYSYGINWVARHDNAFDFKTLVEMYKDTKCNEISVEMNKVTESNTLVSALNEKDFQMLAEVIRCNNNFVTVQTCFHQLGRIACKWSISRLYGCSAGIYSAFVSMNKKYAPCSHFTMFEKFDSLEEYWKKSEVLVKLRETDIINNGICKMCCNKCRPCIAINPTFRLNYLKGLQQCVLFKKSE